MRRYQYRVCQVQQNRITYVNGTWLGTIKPEAGRESAFESCPRVWEYLGRAGEDGWELITASALRPNESITLLYLKRPLHLLTP